MDPAGSQLNQATEQHSEDCAAYAHKDGGHGRRSIGGTPDVAATTKKCRRNVDPIRVSRPRHELTAEEQTTARDVADALRTAATTLPETSQLAGIFGRALIGVALALEPPREAWRR